MNVHRFDSLLPETPLAKTPRFSETPRLGHSHPWLGALVGSIDYRLRQREGVREYTRSPDCMFRIQVIRGFHGMVLHDGTRIQPGAKLINLHLWNEQVPPMPDSGPTIAWARRMMRNLDISLRELAKYVASQPELSDVEAICANLSLASPGRDAQVAHIMQRYGFETARSLESHSFSERMHRFGENVFISLMVFAHNSGALRADSLWRIRVLMCLSPRLLQQRYGLGRGNTG